jgi:hypothetical protein
MCILNFMKILFGLPQGGNHAIYIQNFNCFVAEMTLPHIRKLFKVINVLSWVVVFMYAIWFKVKEFFMSPKIFIGFWSRKI